ncbi:ionotropic receptor 62a [Haematobia irritans]|uniref:ionotropic receptor 62a n=1 Tax=Haematobia irritans TaxID=7368 RepID=UPI003F4F6170
MDLLKFILIFCVLYTVKGNGRVKNDIDLKSNVILKEINQSWNIKSLENEANTNRLSKLSRYLNTIAEYWNMSSIFMIYNLKMLQYQSTRDILEELSFNGTYLGQLPRMIPADKEIENQFYTEPGFNESSLVVSFVHNAYDRIVERTAYATRHRRTCFTIYLIHNSPMTKEDMQYLFEMLWRYQLRRPLVIVDSKEFFTMDPYPKLRVLNVTNKPVSQIFPKVHNIRDFQGYILNIPVQMDVPFTFFYRQQETSEFVIDGIGGWLISTLMQQLNVTLRVYPLYVNKSNYLNIDHILHLLHTGKIELSPHMVTTVAPRDIDYTYPYLITPLCIMTPRHIIKDISIGKFVDWTLCFFIGIVVGVNEIIWIIYRNYYPIPTIQRSYKRSYNWLYVVFLLLGMPVPPIQVPSLGRMSFIIFSRILVVFSLINLCGTCINQLFSTNLSSFLTACSLKEPHFHFENIFSRDIPLMTDQFMADLLSERFKLSEAEKRKYFVIESHQEILKHRNELNTSFMYMVSSTVYEVHKQQQILVDPQPFILTKICYGTFPVQLQLQADSHFTEAFHRFVLRQREAGLSAHFKTELFKRAREHGKMEYYQDDELSDGNDEAFTFNTMSAMIFVLTVGYTCSIFVFLLELYGEELMQILGKTRVWKALKKMS